MYLVRRVWRTKPGQARMAATLVDAMGSDYEKTGKRSASRVYFNSGTLPGDTNRVYMEWTEETIASPYRPDVVASSDAAKSFYSKLREVTEDSWIELYEMMTPDKQMDIG